MYTHITHKVIHAHTNINIYTHLQKCMHTCMVHIHTHMYTWTCTHCKNKTINQIANNVVAETLVWRDRATSSVLAVVSRVLCGGRSIIQTLIERQTYLCHMLPGFLFYSLQSSSQYKISFRIYFFYLLSLVSQLWHLSHVVKMPLHVDFSDFACD